MKKILKYFSILPMLFLATSAPAFAQVVEINPFITPIKNFLAVMAISIIEIFIVKNGLKLTFWRSFQLTVIANFITSLVGVLLFESFLRDFSSTNMNINSFFEILGVFFATYTIEASFFIFILNKRFKKILLHLFIANLISYSLLIIIINVPYLL